MPSAPSLRLPFLFPVLLAAALVVGQLLRWQPFSGSSGGIIALDLAVAVIDLWWLGTLVAQRRFTVWAATIWRHPVWKWSVWFLAWAAISLALNLGHYTGKEDAVALSYLLRLGAMVLLFWLAYYIGPEFRRRWPAYFTGAAVALLALGYLQRVYVPNFQFMTDRGWDPHVDRVLSTFFDPNYFGAFLVLLMAWSLANALAGTARRYWWAGLFVASWAGLYLTVSRSAWIAGLIAATGVALRKSWKLALAFVIAFGVITAIPSRLGERFATSRTITTKSGHDLNDEVCESPDPTVCDASGSARILSYRRGLKLAESNLLYGAGYNAYGYALVRHNFYPEKRLSTHSSQGSDSSLLNILATTGIPGLLLFFGFILATLRALGRVAVQTSDPLPRALFWFTIAWLAASFLNNSLLYPSLLVPWGTLVACALPLLKKTRP